MTKMVISNVMTRASVVYLATNAINGKMYVGKTDQDFRLRLNQHRSCAARGSGLTFHRAIRKYGFHAFWFHILESCKASEALDLEAEWIARLGTKQVGYNSTDGGEGMSGFVVSDETKGRIARARSRQKMKPDHMAALTGSRRGKSNSPEHRAKVGAKVRGQKRTPEQIARIAAAHLHVSVEEYVARRAEGLAHCGGYGVHDPHWYPEALAAQRGRPSSPCRECTNAYERAKRARRSAA